MALQNRGAKPLCLIVDVALTSWCFSVSSAVVQRYLSQIHEAALSPNPLIHSAAVDILTFTVKQGLAHPLQVSSVYPLFALRSTLL